MKHTKGKWDYCISRGPEDTGRKMLSIFKKSGDKDFDSICGIWCNGIITTSHESNAKLISKAPEMYEALKRISVKAKGLHIKDVEAPLFESIVLSIQLLKEIDND